MTITEIAVQLIKPQPNGHIGFASCVLDGCYYVAGIAIFTRLRGGYRLVYPTRKVGDRDLHLHHPISREMGQLMDEAILQRVEEVFSSSARP